MRAQTRPRADGEFEALLRDLAFHVRADEGDCLSYVATRAMGTAEHFVVHARFAGWAGFRAHAETPHMARLLPRLNALLAAPLAMEIFLEV
jgi:quinol monooxygenase YgiN